jgi:hypothetical protein
VTGRPALLGDEAEHQRRIQQCRVGRSQVPCDQDVRPVTVRHTRHGHPEQPGDDAIPHVVQIRHSPRKIVAGAGKQVTVGGKGVIHGAFRGTADVDAALHIGQQLRIPGHHGLRLKYRLGFAAGQIATRDQIGRHRCNGLARPSLLTPPALSGDLPRRRLKHRDAHMPHLADRHAMTCTDASQRCPHLTHPGSERQSRPPRSRLHCRPPRRPAGDSPCPSVVRRWDVRP